MTKDELRMKLSAGKTMDTLFHYTTGQGCLIYKAETFSVGEEIIYIPDIDLNEVPMDRPVESAEIEDIVSACCYTGQDFVDECGGDTNLAERLFHYCDWQHPSSALPEIDDGEEVAREGCEAVNDKGENPVCEKLSFEMILPSGLKLRAKAHPDVEYPCINIDLLGADGKDERLCFVEHNPEKSPGQELCIGAYCSSDEDTAYYNSYFTEDNLSH